MVTEMICPGLDGGRRRWMRRMLQRSALTGIVTVTSLAVFALPAGAQGAPPTGPTPPPSGPPPRSNQAPPAPGGTVSRGIGKCHVISSPDFLGVSCGDVRGGGKKTIKEILGGDPLPGCWNEPMSAQEKQALNLEDTPGPLGYTYWWQKCLHGINPKTLQVEKGGVQLSWGWVAIPNTKGKVVILTKNQRKLIESEAGQGMIPTPLAAISPSGSPVVNQQVAFFDGTGHELTVDAGGLKLRATVTGLKVLPADDGSSTSCPGAGVQVKAEDSRSDDPGACWYHFRHSSAGQPGGRFSGSITASWVVDYSTDGGRSWHKLNSFAKTGLSSQQVDEIQALNVS